MTTVSASVHNRRSGVTPPPRSFKVSTLIKSTNDDTSDLPHAVTRILRLRAACDHALLDSVQFHLK